MAGFTSYESLLRKYVKLLQPCKILEWGPGRSTEIMLDYNVEVWSIEHDPRYYEKAKSYLQEAKNVHLFHVPEWINYITLPEKFGTKFDLIFVDGFCDWRASCLTNSIEFVTENGYVILHDSERTKYNPGRVYYNTVEERDGTAVLRVKR